MFYCMIGPKCICMFEQFENEIKFQFIIYVILILCSMQKVIFSQKRKIKKTFPKQISNSCKVDFVNCYGDLFYVQFETFWNPFLNIILIEYFINCVWLGEGRVEVLLALFQCVNLNLNLKAWILPHWNFIDGYQVWMSRRK